MNEKMDSYYGSEEIKQLSYLEFGSIDIENSKKEIWGYCQHQKAYDYYMFARYANDLFLFRDFCGGKEKTVQVLNEYILKSAHTKLLDYIFKYAGIQTVLNKDLSGGVCESGSSLFGWIDEMIALDYVYANAENINSIKNLKYVGCDISEMMNRAAMEFHKDSTFSFSTADTVGKFMDETQELALFYGLSVSLRYALRTSEDLLKIAQKSELAIFNRLSFSYGDTIKSTVGTGKYVYIISLKEYIQHMEKNGYIAKYCTETLQRNRDGENTIRASIIMSKSEAYIDDFIENYNRYLSMSLSVVGSEQGAWKDICELVKE